MLCLKNIYVVSVKVFIGIFLKGFVNPRMSYASQLFEISVTAAAAAGGCTVRAARQSVQSSGSVTFSSSRPPVTRGSCPPVRRKPSGRDIIKGRNASAGRPSTRLDFSRGFCYAPVQYNVSRSHRCAPDCSVFPRRKRRPSRVRFGRLSSADRETFAGPFLPSVSYTRRVEVDTRGGGPTL